MNTPTKCAMCDHALTDEVSVKFGLGPECREKLKAEVDRNADADTTRYLQPLPNGDIVLRMDGHQRFVGIGSERLIMRHSPSGLNWGYMGSGCADLALNILLLITGDYRFADAHYQRFKEEVISKVQPEGEVLDRKRLDAWVNDINAEEFAKEMAAQAGAPELEGMEEAATVGAEPVVFDAQAHGHLMTMARPDRVNGYNPDDIKEQAERVWSLQERRTEMVKTAGGEVVGKGKDQYLGIGPFLVPMHDVEEASDEEFEMFLKVVKLRAERLARNKANQAFDNYMEAVMDVRVPTVKDERQRDALIRLRTEMEKIRDLTIR